MFIVHVKLWVLNFVDSIYTREVLCYF